MLFTAVNRARKEVSKMKNPVVVSFRCTEEEKKFLDIAAKKLKKTLSEFSRRASLDHAIELK